MDLDRNRRESCFVCCREEAVAAAYPLKRLGNPEDISNLVSFLLSEEASWITGEMVVVDGGLNLSGAIE